VDPQSQGGTGDEPEFPLTPGGRVTIRSAIDFVTIGAFATLVTIGGDQRLRAAEVDAHGKSAPSVRANLTVYPPTRLPCSFPISMSER
jgi:hypothetical protein